MVEAVFRPTQVLAFTPPCSIVYARFAPREQTRLRRSLAKCGSYDLRERRRTSRRWPADSRHVSRRGQGTRGIATPLGLLQNSFDYPRRPSVPAARRRQMPPRPRIAALGAMTLTSAQAPPTTEKPG